uniref:F-box protein 40 n=1 Tax=Labrus bergylta TaxID=56723 RepID=A0A3Q3E3A8_9LABR
MTCFSGREQTRTSRVRQHVHCDSCYSRRCRARVEVSVCCAITPCRLHCGALFHLCKEEDHLLLCPNVRVPCLNVGYGCPLHLPRSSQAAHLQVCPASVICCTMEWLRWPIDETNPHSNLALQDNVMEENKGQGEALDLAMALVDQSDLFSRLKMKHLYPEMMEEEEIKEDKKEGKMVEGFVNGVADKESDGGNSLGEPEDNHVGQVGGINREKYNMYEMMFSMERGGCAATAQKHQDGGVLERLQEDLTPQEYNMYMVHHGRMLVSFGQIKACTPREKDFVYGSLEPIPVQTLRSFKVRTLSWTTLISVESCSVDTSDLGANEEDWFTDEAAATLLGYAEEAVMGHKISVSKAADGLYVDVGTQTHSFHSAPYKGKTTLAEVMVDRPLKLLLQLQAESVNSRNNRTSCVFTYLCGHTFHRREYATHYRNVHSDIQTGLSGWFEQRCPLAYLGCTYIQKRFHPSTHKATVCYNQQLRTFNLRPSLVVSEGDTSQPPKSSGDSSLTQRRRGGQTGVGEDYLSCFPYEVLCHIVGFLDSLSLSQLALVSKLMRQVCSSLLQERGMVTLSWERKTYSHGGAKWKAKPVWEFSHLFSPVDSWRMADIPPISSHLKVCPYYETSPHSEPIPLPSMGEKQESSQERITLVNHFTGKRLQQ